MAERSGLRADDAYRGRRPTSHERRAGEPWDASYVDGPAPWDTGRPQPAIVRLADEGAFAGAVLDAGCGTGLFHSFDADERREYVASLGSVTRRGGRLYVLCFADIGPGTPGPHRSVGRTWRPRSTAAAAGRSRP